MARENNEAAKCLPRVKKYLKGAGLDLGCGSFPIVDNAIGVDLRDGPAKIKSDVRDLSMFADETMDFVFSSHTLEDLRGTRDALAEWARVVKPGGYLVLYLPHEDFYPKVGHPLANRDHVHNFRTWDVIKHLQDPDFGRHPCPRRLPHVGCDCPVTADRNPRRGLWEVVDTSVHGFQGTYEELHAKGGHYEAEYSFQVIARKRGDEPDWAQSRLHVPFEERNRSTYGEEGGFKVCVVVPDKDMDRLAKEAGQKVAPIREAVGGPVDVVLMEESRAKDPDDSEAKAVFTVSYLVIDLTESWVSEPWCAAYDVDCVVGFRDPENVGSRFMNGIWGVGPRTHEAFNSSVWGKAAEVAGKRNAARHSGVSLCMIAKNEEQDLPDCLKSLGNLCDEKIIVDTGSTDRTPEIAREYGATLYYLPWANYGGDCSDFSWSRNFSLERARRKWSMWMDADDVLRTPPEVVRGILDSAAWETCSVPIIYGASEGRHQRFALTEKRMRFFGMVHECPRIDGMRSEYVPAIQIEHGAKPAPPTKNRIERNLAATRWQAECDPENPRHWYYLGNAAREAGNNEEAIAAYERHAEISFHRDEVVNSFRHMGECWETLGDRKKARACFARAMAESGEWAEPVVRMAQLCERDGKVEEAARWYELAGRIPSNPSAMFVERWMYGDRWLEAAALCYLASGNVDHVKRLAGSIRAPEGEERSPLSEHMFAVEAKKKAETPCPVCSRRPVVTHSQAGIGFAVCSECLIAVPATRRPETAPAAVSNQRALESAGWAGQSREIADKIAAEAKSITGHSKLSCIELMSGAPALSARLKELGHEATVVDASPAVADHALSDGLRVVTSKWEDLELSNPRAGTGDWEGSFSVGVMVHALQHFTSLVDDFQKLVDCLEPGGLIFSRHLDLEVKGLTGRLNPETHWALSPRGLEELAHSVGCEVLSRQGRGFGGEVDVWFRKLDRPAIAPVVIPDGKPKRVLVQRNGAHGDILMSTYGLRKLREQLPDDVLIDYACAPGMDALLQGNPDIARIVTTDKLTGDFMKQEYAEVRRFEYPTLKPRRTDCRDHRWMDYPERPLRRHLVNLFAECVGISEHFDTMVIDPDSGSAPGPYRHDTFGALRLVLSRPERRVARHLQRDIGEGRPYVTVSVKTGWSAYKEWPIERWREVVKRLMQAGIYVVQVGSEGEPSASPDEGADLRLFKDLRGKTSLREATGVIEGAVLHLGLDNVFNHVTNAVSTPAVILWGSTSPAGSGYPHNDNLVADPGHGCQPCYRETHPGSVHPKGPCPFEHACMTGIDVDTVLEVAKRRFDALTAR